MSPIPQDYLFMYLLIHEFIYLTFLSPPVNEVFRASCGGEGCMSAPIPPANEPTPPPYVEPGENVTREEYPEVPEPFKYSDIVAECDVDIRHRFLMRVYLLLSSQLAITVALSMVLISHPTWQSWALNHQWSMIASAIGSFAFMGGAMVLRRKYPWNLVFLSMFTLCESWLVGVVTSLCDTNAVVNAFMITTVVFVGLSLFALQTKYDFTSWMPYLSMLLLALLGLGFVTLFTHSSALDLAYSFIGVVLFSVFIIVDTHMIMNKFYPEDEVPATIQLYLDILNLFLYILRILNSNSGN